MYNEHDKSRKITTLEI